MRKQHTRPDTRSGAVLGSPPVGGANGTFDAGALSGLLTGDVVTAGDAGWDQARQPWNTVVDQRPACVVFPADAADVARAVGFAAERGVRVAPQGTGHGPTALG